MRFGGADKGAIALLEAIKTDVFRDLLYYTQTGNTVQVPWGHARRP